MNDYMISENQKTQTLLDELVSLSGDQWKLETDDEERTRIVSIDGLISVRGLGYDRKYHFGLNYSLPFVDYDTIKGIQEKLKTPQNVGTLNSRKINEWMDYLRLTHAELVEVSEAREQKVEDFVKEITKHGATFHNDMSGGQAGKLVKNGIEFSFTISKASGYISRKIGVHYSVDDTLENFIKLADNKYKA